MVNYELTAKEGGKFVAYSEPVSFGKGTGKIEVIRDCGYNEGLLKDTEPRLFVAKCISNDLRPLLSFAKEFIFKSGDNLNHFSNVIRYNNIPACISEELWTIASQNEHKQFKLKTKRYPLKYTYYQNLYSVFCENIENCKLQLPIINAQPQFPQKLSNKVLSVNQLISLGYPVPRSALITGVEKYVIDKYEILRSAPKWLTNAEKLIVRPSLYGGAGINRYTSGMMSSKTVYNLEQLSEQLANFQQKCTYLSQLYEPYQLSVLVQDYIPPKSNGVLFTRIPWDFSSNRFILQLSSKHGIRRYNQSYHHHKITDNFELTNVIDACFELSKYFAIPLEVEFVLTENNDIYFVQFRPVFVD